MVQQAINRVFGLANVTWHAQNTVRRETDLMVCHDGTNAAKICS
jgi:hypothetical protein